jgi:hypothetical protein
MIKVEESKQISKDMSFDRKKKSSSKSLSIKIIKQQESPRNICQMFSNGKVSSAKKGNNILNKLIENIEEHKKETIISHNLIPNSKLSIFNNNLHEEDNKILDTHRSQTKKKPSLEVNEIPQFNSNEFKTSNQFSMKVNSETVKNAKNFIVSEEIKINNCVKIGSLESQTNNILEYNRRSLKDEINTTKKENTNIINKIDIPKKHSKKVTCFLFKCFLPS